MAKKTEPRKKLEYQEAHVVERYHTVWTAERDTMASVPFSVSFSASFPFGIL